MSRFHPRYPGNARRIAMLAASFALCAATLNKSQEQPMRMAMPLVAPLFIEDQDHDSVLRMVNELKATVHATVIAKAREGSVIPQEAVTFPGHTQQILRLRDLLERAGANQAIGSVEVVLDPMEVQSMAIAAQLSITSNRQSPPVYLEEELLSPDPEMPADCRAVVPSALGSPLVALLSTSANPQTVTVTCMQSEGTTIRQAFDLEPGRLMLAPACAALRGGTPTDAEVSLQAVERASSNARQQALAIEASTTGAQGTIAVWGIAAVGSREDRETQTSMALNFANSATVRSPSAVFAGSASRADGSPR